MDRLLSFLPAYCYGILACLYLFSVGWVFQKNRNIIHSLSQQFRSPFVARPAIPAVDISEIAAGIPSVILPAADNASYYSMSLFELAAIGTLLQKISAASVFEIGTFKGRTAAFMAANTPAGTAIYTLDLPRENINHPGLGVARGDREFMSASGFVSEGLSPEWRAKIRLLFGDSASFDFAPYLGAIDLVLVDGAHSYEYVLNDSKKALTLLREGRGAVIWHDYGSWDGVTRALNRLFRRDPAFRGLRHIRGSSLVVLIRG